MRGANAHTSAACVSERLDIFRNGAFGDEIGEVLLRSGIFIDEILFLSFFPGAADARRGGTSRRFGGAASCSVGIPLDFAHRDKSRRLERERPESALGSMKRGISQKTVSSRNR